NKKEPLLNHVMENGVLSMSIKLELSTQVVCKTAQLALPILSQATNDANGTANFLKESFQSATQSANQVSFSLARKVVYDCKKLVTISWCIVVIVRNYY
ncbi:hypothetical protein ABN235_18910, partial [Morganella morganii]|uniref:hypothetical protein n=1 Tax=Morganella morganii TaxID=582 RepID=UPI0032DAAECE